jgi:hypothetical protein
MIYILTGTVLAALFGIGAQIHYGTEGLLLEPWVDMVFFWLIGAGAMLAALDGAACGICRWLNRHLNLRCPAAACG